MQTRSPRSQLSRSLLGLLPVLLWLHCASAAAGAKALPPHWVATWATANVQADNARMHIGQTDTTVRELVRVTLGGPLVRVELSNEFGSEPLRVGSVHLALPGTNGAILLSSANIMTFNGKQNVTIPPGAVAISDPAALVLKPGADLAISIFLPAQKLTHLSQHTDAFTSGFLAHGNQAGRSSLRKATPIHSWFFLKSVQVNVPGKDGVVVAFGDSITDGSGSTPDAHNRWVDLFARRLQQDKSTAGLAVVNEGIGGNRILNDGTGPAAVARFDRDALTIAGVRYIVLLEGINDIGRLRDDAHSPSHISVQELIDAITALIAQAHAHDVKVILATLTPYSGAGYDSPEGEEIRTRLNTWIRGNAISDGVVDFAAATSDPDDPTVWKPEDQAGDHLHPSVAGHQAMADAFNLKLFTPVK